MAGNEKSEQTMPAQRQAPPGEESKMRPRPSSASEAHRGSGKLLEKVAIITGGDSGIGRAVAIAFAREGADAAIVYLKEHGDAKETARLVEQEGRRCVLIAGDAGAEAFCQQAVARAVSSFGRLDIVVNNAAEQHPKGRLEDISAEQLERTFRTNVFSMFHLTKAALPHLRPGSSIINTTSVTAYRGSAHLLDYSASKGAIVAFTRSLAMALVERGIRVNAVAPGPIWTPLIVSTFEEGEVAAFGSRTPMKRPGQPDEVAPSYVLLASEGASYMTGQVLHPNGGQIING